MCSYISECRNILSINILESKNVLFINISEYYTTFFGFA